MFKEAGGKDAWLMERRGKFTASECSKLLLPGPKGAMFSVGGMTYIEAKAIEIVTDVWENPKLEFAKPILWGKRYEQPAFEFYIDRTGLKDMRYFGTEDPLFLELNQNAGGSPDGLMGVGADVKLVLELKCPEQSKTHWGYCKFKGQYDLKDNVMEYYAQVQMLLMITGAPLCHWISFDERFKDHKKKMKLIEIIPEERFQQELSIRLEEAAIRRDDMVNQFLNSSN